MPITFNSKINTYFSLLNLNYSYNFKKIYKSLNFKVLHKRRILHILGETTKKYKRAQFRVKFKCLIENLT